MRFIRFHDRRHPKDVGISEIRTFLSALATEEQVAAATQNLALASLRFLYEKVLLISLPQVDGITPSRRPRRLPTVLTPSEIRAIMAAIREPYRLCVALMYGSGLRTTECVSLRVKDLDLDRREILVRGGKGNKDRRVPLAESCFPELRRILASAGVTTSTKPGCSAPSTLPSMQRRSRSGRRVTPSATRSRPTSSRPAPTSERFRSFSATPT